MIHSLPFQLIIVKASITNWLTIHSGQFRGMLIMGAMWHVNNQSDYADAVKKLVPGDTIMLANGDWKDFDIVFRVHGTADKPITLTTQTKGKVFITDQSNLRLAGEHLIVSGLVFKDGYTPTKSIISFRKSKDKLANHSRVTEVVIDNFNNPERFETDYWVGIYGKHNRFDHNHLEGKRNKGITLAVRLDLEASRENHHRIDHNYFDRCDGELEIISNKSGGNIFRGNVFFESRGTLTMRHGNGTLIENNVFIGNKSRIKKPASIKAGLMWLLL